VAVTGPKPKPREQIRHRNKSPVDWTDVPDVPFDDAPRLPPTPARPARLEPPAPPRPLGSAGSALWERAWRSSSTPPDVDRLQLLCEQSDERVALRVHVLKGDGDWHDRAALRVLDAQVSHGLVALADTLGEPAPARWPTATRRWWRAVSRLPHCARWTDADWQFAADTACLVAVFHAGDHRQAQEIRRRERIMGTTADARRDLRIRYVEPPDDAEHASPSVTAMADYRREVTAR
jgi:hypothetical protein